MIEKEININGEDYIIKKELERIQKKLDELTEIKENKIYSRFCSKVEIKLLKLFAKSYFNETENPISYEEALNREVLFSLDACNVCLCTAKSDEARMFLSRFIDKEFDKKETKLDYKSKEIPKVKISLEYLKMVIDILNVTSDAVSITTKKDYPISVENKDFCFIIAPRVETEN